MSILWWQMTHKTWASAKVFLSFSVSHCEGMWFRPDLGPLVNSIIYWFQYKECLLRTTKTVIHFNGFYWKHEAFTVRSRKKHASEAIFLLLIFQTPVVWQYCPFKFIGHIFVSCHGDTCLWLAYISLGCGFLTN